MKNHLPTDEELRKQYGPHVEIRRQAPAPKEIQEKNSWLEMVAGTAGYQKWMWKSFTGKLLAVVIIPATLHGYIDFWAPKLEVSYEYAAPYIEIVKQAALKMSDELILFGPAYGMPIRKDGDMDRPHAVIVPRTLANLSPSPPAESAFVERGSVLMSRLLWRFTRKGFPPIDLIASSMFGGRWNSPGKSMLYTAEDILGALEEIKTISRNFSPRIFKEFVLHELEMKGTFEFAPRELLMRTDPSDFSATRAYGDLWSDMHRTSALLVPSWPDSSRNNCLIHPADLQNVSVKRSLHIRPNTI